MALKSMDEQLISMYRRVDVMDLETMQKIRLLLKLKDDFLINLQILSQDPTRELELT